MITQRTPANEQKKCYTAHSNYEPLRSMRYIKITRCSSPSFAFYACIVRECHMFIVVVNVNVGSSNVSSMNGAGHCKYMEMAVGFFGVSGNFIFIFAWIDIQLNSNGFSSFPSATPFFCFSLRFFSQVFDEFLCPTVVDSTKYAFLVKFFWNISQIGQPNTKLEGLRLERLSICLILVSRESEDRHHSKSK